MTDNRVSAIITAYNHEHFISDAITSVLAQTRPVDELVIIDDGSTDDTLKVVSRFLEKGVRYIWQTNLGEGMARNRGIQETSGEYIAFLDADDIWLEDKTQKQLDFLQTHPDVAMVSGLGWWLEIETDRRWVFGLSLKQLSKIQQDMMIHNNFGNTSMVFLRRSILNEVGFFDPSLRWGTEWDMWTRIVSQHKVSVIPDPVIIYRRHQSNISLTGGWEQDTCYWTISKRAITKYIPAWQRPFLLARSWSNITLSRAYYAFEQKCPRRKQIAYATGALIAYPFEKSVEKLKVFIRAIIGKNLFQRGRQMFTPWIKKAPP